MQVASDALLDRIFGNTSFIGVETIGPGWGLEVESGGGVLPLLNALRGAGLNLPAQRRNSTPRSKASF